MNLYIHSQELKAEAKRLGFSACGLAPAEDVEQPIIDHFKRWIANHCQAGMDYMMNYEEKRFDPRLLVDHAHTVISVALNYYPEKHLPPQEYQFAWYAYGKDYHDIVKAKLIRLLEFLQDRYGVNGRVFCDTAPVLERYWAWRAGLGWIGKNTQLIIPHAGSCFFLGELIIDQPADQYDTPQPERCGNCTRCLTACPTQALTAPYTLDANRCLSYLTIEHRGSFPEALIPQDSTSIYGCDECQKACPWNRFSTPCRTPELAPSDAFLQMTQPDWNELSVEKYRMLFKGSAVKRAKYDGLMRNIRIVQKQKTPHSSLPSEELSEEQER